jgi:rhodanese-related sulfurtransferase
MRKASWLLMAAFLVLLPLSAPRAQTVDLVDKDTLKGWLGQAEVVIIDVRTPKDWAGSQKKIQGAVRQDPGKVAAWGKTLPRDKTIVLYCS